jgi:hypothetical protein
MLSGLRQFTERFKTRLVDMALREVTPPVRQTAIQVVTRIAQVGLMEDKDRLQVLPLLFSEDPKVRELVSSLAGEVLHEDFVENAKEDAKAVLSSARAARGLSDSSDELALHEDWLEAKSLCQMIVEVSKVVDEKKDLAKGKTNQKTGDKNAGLTGGQFSVPLSQGFSQQNSFGNSQNFDDDDEDDIEDQNVMDEDDDLVDEVRDSLCNRMRMAKELWDWCEDEEDVAGGPTFMGSSTVGGAVSALWSVTEVMKVGSLLSPFGEFIHHDLTLLL